ncbi:MAG: hypothetical protein ACOX69_07135 [Coriobacteriales bacterium]|jgi:hypothetical protein
MTVSEAQKAALKKYRAEKTKTITVRFYPKEMDIWEQLSKAENKQGLIKQLLREYFEGQETADTE